MPVYHAFRASYSNSSDEACELALSGPNSSDNSPGSTKSSELDNDDIEMPSPTVPYIFQAWKLAQPTAPQHPTQRAYRRTGEPIPGLTYETHLGQGSQGLVELMKCKATGELYVAKIFRSRTEFENEASLLRTLHQGRDLPQIIKPVFHHSEMPYRDECTLMLEYCNMPDLFAYKEEWSDRGLAVPEIDVWSIVFQLSEALAFLHEGRGTGAYTPNPDELTWNPVIHRDIKPENILLHRAPGRALPVVKLSDFGLATYFDPANCRSMSGTALYFPPEIPLWSPPGDVWALGATIHYLCTGQPPRDFSAPQTGFADMYAWAASLTYAVIAIDVEPERRTIVPMDGWALASWNVHVYPAKLASFMYHMLNFSAGQRITAVELVEEVGEVLMGVYMSMGYEDMDREEREMWDMVARSAL